MPKEPDADLLARFVRGDRDAFESLFRQFEAGVYRWIVRIVRDCNGAEDALVETFWRVYCARARFDSSRSFGAWLRRIATNAALDHLRAGRRHADVEPLPASKRRKNGCGWPPRSRGRTKPTRHGRSFLPNSFVIQFGISNAAGRLNQYFIRI